MSSQKHQQAEKIAFYCTRCKRHLKTKICSIHGLKSVVVLDMSNHMELPPPVLTTEKPTQKPPTTAEAPAKKPPIETVKASKADSNGTPKKAVRPTATATVEVAATTQNTANRATETAAPESETSVKPGRKSGDIAGNGQSPDIDAEENTLSDLIEKRLQALKKTPAPAQPANGAHPGDTPETDAKTPRHKYAPLDSAPWWQQNSVKYALFAAIAVLVIAGGYGVVYPKFDRNMRFERAEALFSAGEYRQAKAQYELFALKYPLDTRINVVKARLEALISLEAKAAEQRQRLTELMERATVAYRQKCFLTPEHDNAMRYIDEILAEKPDYSMALTLREQIARHYFEAAETALQGDHFEEAITHFQQLLLITPNDPAVVQQINRTLELRQLDTRLQKLQQLARAKDDVRRLKSEMQRLKEEIRLEQQKLQAIRESDSKGPVQAEQQNRDNTGDPSAGRKISHPADLGIALLDDPTRVKLVEETLIDGGKKEYVHRVRPEQPVQLQSSSDIAMVLAECIVDTDGSVASVTLVNGTEDPDLNQLAMESFRQYRYKPATHNGKPVRFKSLEVLAF